MISWGFGWGRRENGPTNPRPVQPMLFPIFGSAGAVRRGGQTNTTYLCLSESVSISVHVWIGPIQYKNLVKINLF